MAASRLCEFEVDQTPEPMQWLWVSVFGVKFRLAGVLSGVNRLRWRDAGASRQLPRWLELGQTVPLMQFLDTSQTLLQTEYSKPLDNAINGVAGHSVAQSSRY